jgi:serine acetyltransferase
LDESGIIKLHTRLCSIYDIMTIVKTYIIFVRKLTDADKSTFSIILNRRTWAFLLLYFSSQTSGLNRYLRYPLILALRFFFSIEGHIRLNVLGPVFFPHPRNIVIGADSIGNECVIYHNVTLGAKRINYIYNADERPKIDSKCVLCTGAVIVGGGIIKPGTIIAANSLTILNSEERHGQY